MNSQRLEQSLSTVVPFPNRETVTAHEFEAFMVYIWSDVYEPCDGGMALYHGCGQAMYDQYHDARKVAHLLGGRRTGGKKDAWGDNWDVYTFDSGARVDIRLDGAGVTPNHGKYWPRRNRTKPAATAPTA